MNNVAVIGAAGFVGQHLCKVLSEVGCIVLAYDCLPPAGQMVGVNFMPIDLAREAPVFPQPVDAVFYLAQSPFYREFPAKGTHLFAVNTQGALSAAIAAKEAGAKLFFYASTGNVYESSFLPRAESDAVNRLTPYGLSKLQGEELVSLLSGEEMQIVCGRFFCVFGENQRAMLPVLLRKKVEAGEAIRLDPAPSDGAQTEGLRLSCSYVGDLALWLKELMVLACAGQQLPQFLNMAGEEVISLKHFGETLGKIIGKPAVFEVGTEMRKSDLLADITRLRALIKPRMTPFAEALVATLSMKL